MYISELTLKNFRCFPVEGRTIRFNQGLNVLVGENDSGKTAVIDAIRIVLGTTDQAWYRVDSSDFFKEDMSMEITIILRFDNLTEDEQAAFVECLSYEENDDAMKVFLNLTWTCRHLSQLIPPRTATELATGKNGDGPAPAQAARELLRVTYLKALRDAYSEMQSGRNSRLSQVMQHISDIKAGEDHYSEGMRLDQLSVAGIVDLANKLLEDHPAIKSTSVTLSENLQDKLLLKNDNARAQFSVSGSDSSPERRLISMLEKLDLRLLNDQDIHYGRVGLGTSSILSMACELLLHQEKEKTKQSTILLIEEPEEHIHAQRQLRLIQTLQNSAINSQQIILTTHSPLLASVVSLGNLIIMKDGTAYPMSEDSTLLGMDDYRYLERYLDATKANLFFAKGVIVVEGPSEELLLPTIAKLIGKDLIEYGVSIVNVRGVGLRRYAKVFQRKDVSRPLDVPVACITDRDVLPDCAPKICINESYTDKSMYPSRRKWKVVSDFVDAEAISELINKKKAKGDGQRVKTFVSDYWTFEYDLAVSGLMRDMIDALSDLYNEDEIVKEDIDTRDTKRDELREGMSKKIMACATVEESAATFQSYFTKKGVSKAVYAQVLALMLEDRYMGSPVEANGSQKKEEFKAKLPSYIKDAIAYVTEEN